MEVEYKEGKYICKNCGRSLRYRPSAGEYTCPNKNCEYYWGRWHGNVFRPDE